MPLSILPLGPLSTTLFLVAFLGLLSSRLLLLLHLHLSGFPVIAPFMSHTKRGKSKREEKEKARILKNLAFSPPKKISTLDPLEPARASVPCISPFNESQGGMSERERQRQNKLMIMQAAKISVPLAAGKRKGRRKGKKRAKPLMMLMPAPSYVWACRSLDSPAREPRRLRKVMTKSPKLFVC